VAELNAFSLISTFAADTVRQCVGGDEITGADPEDVDWHQLIDARESLNDNRQS
jgi:hypothetical protein